MKKTNVRLIRPVVLISVMMSVFSFTNAQTIPDNQLYLGQTPPGNTPIVFNLSTTQGLRPVERIAITSDGKEIYYSELNTYPATNERIKCYGYVNNKWEDPIVVFEGFSRPRLSPDENTMYMQKDISGKPNMFYSVKNNNIWSTPKRLFSKINDSHYFQKTNSGTCYFATTVGSAYDICKMVVVGSDTTAQSLGTSINTAVNENDFFVAPDESYIIFCRWGASSDNYISFRKKDGTWEEPKKFDAPINTPSPNWEYGQFISKDGKYFFFTRGGNAMSSYYVYWVKIDNIIESLRPKTSVNDNSGQIPSSLELYQNYPNPFNPTTSIEFSIPKSGKYSLSVFNVLGKLVEVVSEKEYSAGLNKETFDANGLASGIYFYRLTGSNTNVVRNMILLR